jgi:hypothetical protein
VLEGDRAVLAGDVATRVISSISSRGWLALIVNAKRMPMGMPWVITENGNRVIVEAVAPPKMMMTACLS